MVGIPVLRPSVKSNSLGIHRVCSYDNSVLQHILQKKIIVHNWYFKINIYLCHVSCAEAFVGRRWVGDTDM